MDFTIFCQLFKFTRCCCCVPLRFGVLFLGYTNIIYLICFIALCITLIGEKIHVTFYKGTSHDLNNSVSLAIACIDLCFKILLLYATHMRNFLLLKASQYYALVDLMITVVLEILGLTSYYGGIFTLYIPFFVLGFGINLYFYFLIRNLVLKLEMPETQQDHDIEKLKVEGKGHKELSETV